MSKKPKDRPTVELVHPSYPPSKDEKEEEIALPNSEGRSPQDVARVVLWTVNVRHVGNPTRGAPPSCRLLSPLTFPEIRHTIALTSLFCFNMGCRQTFSDFTHLV